MTNKLLVNLFEELTITSNHKRDVNLHINFNLLQHVYIYTYMINSNQSMLCFKHTTLTS